MTAKCPRCHVEYVKSRCDFEYEGLVLKGVECTRCPGCGVELFTPEQYEEVRRRLSAFVQPLRLTRKISSAGKKPIVYLPDDITKAVGLKVGDKVDIYLQGKKRIVIEPADV